MTKLVRPSRAVASANCTAASDSESRWAGVAGAGSNPHIGASACSPPIPPHSLAHLQARAAAGCDVRYLGASTSCAVTGTGLYALSNATAILRWQLTTV